jgi:hypothetical protein
MDRTTVGWVLDQVPVLESPVGKPVVGKLVVDSLVVDTPEVDSLEGDMLEGDSPADILPPIQALQSQVVEQHSHQRP